MLVGGERKGKHYPAEVLTSDEVRALVAACTGGDLGHRNKALLLLLARCGCRVGELVALLPCHVARDVCRVLRGKGAKARTIGVEVETMAAVADWLTVRERRAIGPRVPLACTLKGEPLSADAVRSLLRRLSAKIETPKRIRCHTLRHYFAANLGRQLPLPLIAESLGHSDLSTCAKYLGGLMGQSVDAVRRAEW